MRNMFTGIVCAVTASAAILSIAPLAAAVPVAVTYSGTVSSTEFTGGNFGGVNVGDAASVTVAFDTSQQGDVFSPPGDVGSLYNAPIEYVYNIGGVTGSAVNTTSFFRFTSDIDVSDDYGLVAPVIDNAIDAGVGYRLGRLIVLAEGSGVNPFGIETPNIEDIAGMYDGSLFDTLTFEIQARVDGAFARDDLIVAIDTVTVTVIPAPGAAAAFSLASACLLRRRR